MLFLLESECRAPNLINPSRVPLLLRRHDASLVCARAQKEHPLSSPIRPAVKPDNFDHHALQNPVCTERFPAVTPLGWHSAMEYIHAQGKRSDSVLVTHWRDLKRKRVAVVQVEGNGRQKRKRGEAASSTGMWHGIYDDDQ